jgi:hypothetical protein
MFICVIWLVTVWTGCMWITVNNLVVSREWGCSKGKGLPITGKQELRGGVEVQFYLFSTSALGGCKWSAPRHGRVTPGKTRYPLYRRLGGPQGRSGQVQWTCFIPYHKQIHSSHYPLSGVQHNWHSDSADVSVLPLPVRLQQLKIMSNESYSVWHAIRLPTSPAHNICVIHQGRARWVARKNTKCANIHRTARRLVGGQTSQVGCKSHALGTCVDQVRRIRSLDRSVRSL